MKVLSEGNPTVLGTDAVILELSYSALDLPESLKGKLVPTRERVVIFKRGDTFYYLRYENFAVDFDRYNAAFDHVIKSLSPR
jgi:hypothetical protein